MIFRSGRNKRGASKGVSRADVEVAYQALLGRKPESEEAIRHHLAAGSFKALIEGIAASDEASYDAAKAVHFSIIIRHLTLKAPFENMLRRILSRILDS